MLLYIPVNRFISGGSTLKTLLDNLIPLTPVFVIPYLSGLLFWLATVIYINLKQVGEQVLRFNFMMILAGILSVLIYILLPTFMNRPAIIDNDIFSRILSWVYATDRAYNAAPSGHTFYTIICFLALWKVAPKYRTVWTIISILIIASTLFTKQHNVLDVLLGTGFAMLIYLVSANFVVLKKLL